MKPKIYCAIYTRKSTSEGLDTDFTSLDNQRESSESYIQSQKSEGWIALPDRYDDGGYTGGNTERPALQRLITDIKEGKVNCVVVYKVDRLSRSLLDFVQILELFEKNGVTFVSVTQHFNTNNSMGRLTLNILLSFAQFEREIISERVKDKMGAARKKGKWVGGAPILGYDIDKVNHKLVVNKTEAELVRKMFDIYLEKKSCLKTAMTLNDEGYKTKEFISKTGNKHGGFQFKHTNIQQMLKNPLYVGKVHHDGALYPGLQEAIISEAIFQRAQDLLKSNRVERFRRKNVPFRGLLNHILRCKACDSIMFHTYTKKKHRGYRYYVCMNAQKRGYQNCPTRSVNAQSIEDAVIESLRTSGKDDQALDNALIVNSPIWEALFPQEKHHALRLMLKSAYYDGKNEKLGLAFNPSGIALLNRMQEGLPDDGHDRS
ncbi:MAG: recombinase family protein [Candidatus Omnitrophica bacterium]|nr:recombinase family protein [Candidatus Omnitrophota bacterium]